MEAVARLLALPLSGSSISQIANHCRALLQICLQVPSLKEDEWAENRLAEFNLWAANSGVFAGDKASLDSRLALQQDVKSVITSLLTVLSESLIQCHYIGRNNTIEDEHSPSLSETEDEVSSNEDASPPIPPEPIPRAFSPWSDASSTDSDEESEDKISPLTRQSMLSVPKNEVAQAISHLARLSLAIRKSGSNSRSQKADRRFDPEAHTALRRQLNYVVLAKGSEEGWASYDVDLGGLTSIQERLILANLRRRNRFLYAQRHSRKLAFEALTNAKPEAQDEGDWPVLIEDNEERKIVEDPPEELQSANPEELEVQPLFPYAEQQLEPQAPVLTATSASAATQAIDPAFFHNATPSQVAKTNITTTTAKITYPRPPAVATGMHYFKCPCCCQALPEMYRQHTLWKKHLMVDICPYTCIIEDCPTPDQLYVTRNEWTRHVEKEHQQCWQCFACTTSGKAPLVFPSVEGFLEHLRQSHANSIKEEQYSTLVPEATRSVPVGIDRCPLCESTGPADSRPLLDHIAEHLHAFALRSLPWPKDDSIDEDTTEDGNDFDYFNENDYFDQSSEVESRQDNLTSGSDRDSDGLPSLHSSQASIRPPTVSDAGSEIMDGDVSPLTPLVDAPIIPLNYDTNREPPLELDLNMPPEVHVGPTILTNSLRFWIHPATLKNLEGLLGSLSVPLASRSSRNWVLTPYIDRCDPIEVCQLVPEVVEGEWPEICPSVLIDEYDDPELLAQRERLLELMLRNHAQRLEQYKSGARKKPLAVKKAVEGDSTGFHTKPYFVRARDCKAQGKLAEAIQLQIQAIAILKPQIGPLHPKRLELLNELANMYQENGQPGIGKTMLKDEAQLDNLKIGSYWSHDDTDQLLAGTMYFGDILCEHGLFQEAEQLQTQIITNFTEDSRFGARHSVTLNATEQLSQVFVKQGKWEKVRELETDLVAKYDLILDARHPKVLERTSKLAWAVWSLGLHRELAMSLQKRVVKEQKEVLALGDEQTLASMDTLCEMYVWTGQLQHAIEVKAEESSIRVTSHNLDVSSTVRCILKLADMYESSERERDAKKTREVARWLSNPESRRGPMPSLPGPSQVTGLARRLRFWRR